MSDRQVGAIDRVTPDTELYREGTKVIDCGEEGVIKRAETHPNGRTTYYIEFDDLEKVDGRELELGIVDGTIQVIP